MTGFYLNGNPKHQEVHTGAQRKRFTTYWDTGKVKRQGELARCAGGWCEQGAYRSFFENGAPESESHYQNGKQTGPARS